METLQRTQDGSEQVLAALGITRASLSEATILRVLSAVDAAVLAAAIGAWLWTRTAVIGGVRVVACDGKSLRSIGDKGVSLQPSSTTTSPLRSP